MSIVKKKKFTREQKLEYITNNFNLPLDIVVPLIHNVSNHVDTVDLSASGMSQTIRQIIFGYRYPELSFKKDLIDAGNLATSLGNAWHMWAEDAWLDPITRKAALIACGINVSLADSIVVNPDVVGPNQIPVYLEHTFPTKTVNGMVIGGTTDLIFNGKVKDNKTLSPYAMMYENTINSYILQMGTYRWLDPNMITHDEGTLVMRFPKWDAKSAGTIKGYPQLPVMCVDYPLPSLEAMDDFIDKKTKLILENIDMPDDALPPCPKERLEITKKYKIFTTLDQYREGKASRRTLNTLDEAFIAMDSIKKGVLIELTSSPSLCKFCPFTSICNQHAQINKEQVRVLKEW